MQVYSYNSHNGEFVAQITADESPLEPGVYLIPAWATEVSPPQSGPMQAGCWRDGAWVLVPDHRGETWYLDGQPVAIQELGSPADMGMTRDAPPPPPVPAPVVSRRQFFQQAAMAGDITPAEALAAVQSGAIPAPMQLFIDALPVEQQFGAQMLIAGAAEFDPVHPLSDGYAMATGRSAEAKDQFFRDAAAL